MIIDRIDGCLEVLIEYRLSMFYTIIPPCQDR